MTRMISDLVARVTGDDSLVNLESVEDSRSVARGTNRTEEPGGSDVLRI